MPGLDILWAGVTVGRRRGGGGGRLREVGVAGEAEAIRVTSAYSAEEVTARRGT